MAVNGVSHSQHRQILELSNLGQSSSQIAEKLGLGKTSVLKYKHLPLPEENSGGEQESHEMGKDTWTITLPRTRIKSLDELIEHCDIDLSIWEVDHHIINKWEVGAKLKEADGFVVEPLFQVKAWLKKKVNVSNAKDEIASLKEDAKLLFKGIPKIFKPKVKSGNILELSMPDLHVGKLAWGVETMHGDYDVSIATRVFEEALDNLIARTSNYDYEEVVFVVGNDLLHSDNRSQTTTAGTPMETDSRYHKTFRTVRIMMANAINKLRTIAPVRVVMVPGNHDELSTWHLGDSLECLFSSADDVTIDNTPTLRKYLQYGQVMLLLCHGNKGKKEDYPLLMATEQPRMFGSTLFREAHTGHLHQTQVFEKHGVKVRILPSLTGTDTYHSDNCYTDMLRSAEAFIWNKDEGLLGTSLYTIKPQK